MCPRRCPRRCIRRRARSARDRQGRDGAGRRVGRVAAAARTRWFRPGFKRHCRDHGLRRRRTATACRRRSAATAATTRRRSSARCSTRRRSTSGPTSTACMSGDPRRVPEAKIIDEMSYSEAMELAYFGAKVIHPQTMAPAVGRGIPIWIRNTFNADASGHARSRADVALATSAVKGISGVDGVALVNLEGAGMIGVPGTADRLFGALREAGISVMMISQGSSEHSICFAVPRRRGRAASRSVVERAFAAELAQGQMQRVERRRRAAAILAVVGDGMAGMPGSRGAILRHARQRRHQRARDRAGRVGAQHLGGHRREGQRRVRCAPCTAASICRRRRYRSACSAPAWSAARCSTSSRARGRRLRDDFNLDLRVRAIARLQEDAARRAAHRPRSTGATRSSRRRRRRRSRQLVDHVQTDYLPHSVLIDCTASQEVADRYADVARRAGST